MAKTLKMVMKTTTIFMIILSILIYNINISKALADNEFDLGVDMSDAFNSWTPISKYTNGTMNFPGKWSYNSAGYIVNAENTSNMTGFYNPTTNFEDMDITMKMGSWNGDDDTLGCMIRFSEDSDHNCTGYIFAYDRGGSLSGGLYKIEGKQFFTSNLTKLVSFPNIKWTYQQYDTIRIISSGNNIKVYVNGTLCANYTDPEPIKSGSYGFFSCSQADSRYKDITGKATLAQFTINFDANGGTITSGETTQTVMSTKKYGTLPTTTRNGYTFSGWYTEKTGGYKIKKDDTVNIAANTTFYARWVPNSYDVTCIDIAKDSNIELGRSTYSAKFDSTTSGSILGTNNSLSAYYTGYTYDSCTSIIVNTKNNIVYRYFSPYKYVINSSSSLGGTISNKTYAEYNTSSSVFIVPMKGYEIENVVVDGVSVGKAKTYNFLNVNKNHTVTATFNKTSNWISELNKMNLKYNWINIKHS